MTVHCLNGGESRGTCLLADSQGAPSGLSLTIDRANDDQLFPRQGGVVWHVRVEASAVQFSREVPRAPTDRRRQPRVANETFQAYLENGKSITCAREYLLHLLQMEWDQSRSSACWL